MFVRTKEGKIIKVDETGCIKEIDVCGKKCLFLFNKNYFYGREVIKQADSIEELCDYFLIDKNDIEHYEPTTLLIFDDYDDFKYSMFGYEFASGYGCIKTDKGLIYVAKFNWNDEEFELLCQN